MFAPPVMQELTGGRLHLSHGPIDVVLRVWGSRNSIRIASAAACERFQTILPDLCDELVELRRPMSARPCVTGTVARRMLEGCNGYGDMFITPMAAVAGAVADELLACLKSAAPIERAYVNNGGDIAIHVTEGHPLDVGVAGEFSRANGPILNGKVQIDARSGVGGIATSGARGRSFSLGIADSVTVLASDAASADAAATMIANAVNIDSPTIERRPAHELDPDSDLGGRLVTVAVGPLSPIEIAAALDRGWAYAEGLKHKGLVVDAAMMLAGYAQTLSARPPRHPLAAE